MQMFLLSQSGYRVKVARMDNHLTLFYASSNMIYATCFITLNGVNYYRFDTTPDKTNSIYTYNRDFANAKNPVNMNITTPQPFSGTYVEKTLQAKAYPSVKVCSKVNSGLISFYKDYPQCDFSVYVGAPVSQEVQQTVLPSLQAAIQGKKQSEAANILINFVQTAFDYKTDGDQFGYEKPFFVDELFYYPYSDCEDRAVLYSYLVRTLMGLDVVLLEYPNHMATAVCFDENYVSEWWKQLYGESEGKDNKGIFPASVDFSTDLHSMGQWIQEGERSIFETVISVEKVNHLSLIHI